MSLPDNRQSIRWTNSGIPSGILIQAVRSRLELNVVNSANNSYTPIAHYGRQIYMICKFWETSKHAYVMLMTEEGTAVYWRGSCFSAVQAWIKSRFIRLT